MVNIVNFTVLLAGTLIGLLFSYTVFKNRKFFNLEKNEKEAENLIQKSENEATEIKEQAKDYVQKTTKSIEQGSLRANERIKKLTESLDIKGKFLTKKEERVKEVKLKIASLQEETQGLENSIKRTQKGLAEKLAEKIGRSIGDVFQEIIHKYEKDIEAENLGKIAKHEEVLKEEAMKTAKKIIINTIQRLSSPTSVETRAVTIAVPKDQIKGVIVGKDAINIKTFEELLDVDVVFNDLPNTISISAFQLVERRVAIVAMEKLIKVRSSITPEVVKKTVAEARKETDEQLYEIGKAALAKIGIKHYDKDFIRILGRLQYRTSYGQNIMKHSLEVGWVAAMLGSEIGLDIDTCKVAGFLHDLGKAIDQDPNVKDAHDYLTKELMEKYGFSYAQVHAAWTHHNAIPQETPEALIVQAADAVSASRPGARQESLDRYLERIKVLQETAESFEGIKKAFALSAGRELRAMVDPEKIDDEGIKVLAKQLAEKVENDVVYPGQIKVNVIRKTKYTETAY